MLVIALRVCFILCQLVCQHLCFVVCHIVTIVFCLGFPLLVSHQVSKYEVLATLRSLQPITTTLDANESGFPFTFHMHENFIQTQVEV